MESNLSIVKDQFKELPNNIDAEITVNVTSADTIQ